MTGSVLHVVSRGDDLDERLAPLVQAGAARGFRVLGVSSRAVQPRRWPLLDAAPVEWLDGRQLRATFPALWRDVRELSRIVENASPDVVHIHAGPLALAAHLSARRASADRVVYTTPGLDGFGGGRAQRYLTLLAERFIAGGVDAVVVPSIAVEDLFLHTLRLRSCPMTVAGTGIDLGRFDPDRRLHPDTRSHPETQSHPDSSEHPVAGNDDVVCGVFGLAGFTVGDVDSATGTGDAAKVSCVEFVADEATTADARAAFLSAVDVVVIGNAPEAATGRNTLGLAREAAAMGKVAIAEMVPGIRLVVEDARTGFLVNAGDPAAIVRLINELVVDPQRRNRIGRAARAKAVHEFDQRREIDAILGAYGEAAGRAKERTRQSTTHESS